MIFILNFITTTTTTTTTDEAAAVADKKLKDTIHTHTLKEAENEKQKQMVLLYTDYVNKRVSLMWCGVV